MRSVPGDPRWSADYGSDRVSCGGRAPPTPRSPNCWPTRPDASPAEPALSADSTAHRPSSRLCDEPAEQVYALGGSVRARVSVCAQPSRRPSFRWSANPRWALSRQAQTPRAQAQRPRAAGFPSRTGDNACVLEVPDLQGFWALFGGFLFAEVGLGGVRFAEFGARLETSRAGERRRPPGS
jgi:hypothetical protein